MLLPSFVYVPESGCLLPSLPSDVTFDQTTGISFTCDLNDNIAAPWPSSSETPSSCNKSTYLFIFMKMNKADLLHMTNYLIASQQELTCQLSPRPHLQRLVQFKNVIIVICLKIYLISMDHGN